MYDLIHSDLKILKAIQEPTATPMPQAQIAQKIDAPSASTVSERLNLLRRDGVIRNWAAALDPRKVGIKIIALVGVVIRPHNKQTLHKFEDEIRDEEKFPEVLECYSLTGAYDYWLKIAAPDIEQYAAFIHDKLVPLDMVASLNSHILLREIRYGTKLPLEHITPVGKVMRHKREGAAEAAPEK